MENLSKFQIAAIKRMELNLKPLVKRLETLDNKIAKVMTAAEEKIKLVREEKAAIEGQIEKLEEAMNSYTGGVPYRQILYPETSFTPVETGVEVESTIEVTEDAPVDPEGFPMDMQATPEVAQPQAVTPSRGMDSSIDDIFN